MQYKQAMQMALERTINSDQFNILTMLNVEPDLSHRLIVTKSGRVFSGGCLKIFEEFTNAVLSDIQGYYVYLKAEGQIDDEPCNGTRKAFQKQFLTDNFDLEDQIEQILAPHLFKNLTVFV
jgi:small nuclear ribonucleoprotein (snRNP)-like protein